MNASALAARPRGWYHGWTIVAVCIVSQSVANGLTYNSFSLFLRDWSAQLHTPISSLTLAVAVMGTVAALIAPLAGVFADKYPARIMFVIGLAGIAILYLAVGSVTARWQLMVLYGLLAPVALVCSTAVIANALISRWFVRRRGLAFGLSAFGIGLAGVVLPPVIQYMLPQVGWRAIWWAGGALVAVLVIPLVLLTIRNRPTEEEGRYYLSGSAAPAGHHGPAVGASQLGWREVLARKNFWLLVGIFVPIVGLNGACMQNIVPYAANHGLTPQTGARLLSLLSMMHVLAVLGLGLVSDRFGNRGPFLGLAVIMVAGAALLAVGSDLSVIVAGCVLIGLGGGVFTPLASAIAVEFGAEGVGRAFGLCMFFIPLTSLAPFALAKTQEVSGSYAPAFIGAGIILALSGVLGLFLRERRGAATASIAAPAAASANTI